MRLSNFEAAYRLSRRMSTAAYKMDFEPLVQPDNRFEPVEIGPSEALVIASAVCAREKLALSSSLDLPDMANHVEELKLFYVPFHPEHYFFVDSILGAVTVEKSLIAQHGRI